MSQREALGRREFMTMSAAATVFALDGLGDSVAVAATPAVAATINVKTATSATFKALIGQSFEVSGTKQKFVLDQVQVTNDPNKAKRPRGIRQESFLLLFSAPANVHLPDGIYTFTSAKRVKFDVSMNEIRVTSTLSTNSALGQAERFLGIVANNVKATPAKAHYQVPFS